MVWRLALIDSCGAHPAARRAAQFALQNGTVRELPAAEDLSGHGSRIVRILMRGQPDVELSLAQVFGARAATSPAVVAAAIDWCVAAGADLLHLSLGLAADRQVLAAAVRRALGQGCLVVAATPARGGAAYPAAYPGVIKATGDARCQPGEVSRLAPGTFGGCPRSAGAAMASGGGASIGAAEVTRALIGRPVARDAATALAALEAMALYDGAERRSDPASQPRSEP